MEKDSYQEEREKMVRQQIIRRGIVDARLLAVMEKLPRHRFVPAANREEAYEDRALPIAVGQTISQPYIVALMTSLLELQGEETVLEVGTGSGYQAAVLAGLAHTVHTVERHPSLAAQAEAVLDELGISNVHIHIGDGSLGWPEAAPYQAIIVTAAAPQVAAPLLGQLADGGRLVVPAGGRSRQVLERWRKNGDDFQREEILPVAFVPLIGEQGWAENPEP